MLNAVPDFGNGARVRPAARHCLCSPRLTQVAGAFHQRPPSRKLQFTKDPVGKLEGVIDVFGDGSLFAILTPGHTEGHVSYLARTPSGAVLLTGDASRTRWGWDNDVEPGTYTFERDSERKSLLALKALSASPKGDRQIGASALKTGARTGATRQLLATRPNFNVL